MLKFNFYLQTILLIIALALLALPVWLLYYQFLIGAVQMILSTVFLLTPKWRNRLVVIHWCASVVVLSSFFFLKGVVDGTVFFWVFLVAIPWSLAVFFWYVSYRMYKSN